MLRTVAVIVTFQPDQAMLLPLLDSLEGQVDFAVVVDNGSSNDVGALLRNRLSERIVLLALGENLGIAFAQNRGIDWARAVNATHIVLFDHDSQPRPDMVARLLDSAHFLTEKGYRVGSIGPRYSDVRQDNPPPFIRLRDGKLTRCLEPELGDSVSVDYLIASGCLIPIEVLNDVGDMNESLFIDYVDIEWGQRARSNGYQNFGCFSAVMSHSLGDEPIRFCGTAYPARSPLRHYYMFRNAVLLYKMNHVPADWKWADGMRGVLRFVFYVLFAKPRWQHFRMMVRGIVDGLNNRSGKLVL